MAKLWLTYAWIDNVDEDVDHVITELNATGLEVVYDRVQLLAGQRLWQQLDQALNDPSIDAWAMLVTENSLRSEPCQEEIAYALDRALRTKDSGFPLIGIFPHAIDRALIPSALATRLYVHLTAPDWTQQVYAGVAKSRGAAARAAPAPFGYEIRQTGGQLIVEIWKRSGRWYPFFAAVPIGEDHKLLHVTAAPRGARTMPGTRIGVSRGRGKDVAFEQLEQVIDANNSAHVFLQSMPTVIHFGQPDGDPCTLKLGDGH